MRDSGVVCIGGSHGLTVDLSGIATPARRLATAVEESRAAWFGMPAWVRERMGKLALVLDAHPGGSGLRKVPADIQDGDWCSPDERWEMT